ncbi:pentatricopeptide repeat-containing protein [Tanacetum coccineum]
MHSLKLTAGTSRLFSTSVSKRPSVVPWISPHDYIKAGSPKPDPPTESSDTVTETPKKSKYISHELAITLIKREKDPNRVLDIFNKVAHQKGFNHNHSTYAVTLHKLARLKKFEDVDSILYQMTYETCKFHESIFLDLMTHFSKSSLHKRVLDMFNHIQPICREKPSLKAVSTCLNLLVETNQVDLARTFLLNTKHAFDMHFNTCIFNILVKHHCKQGNLESAFEVVKEMKLSKLSYPNLITYSTLREGLCEKGILEEAINLFEDLSKKI